MDEGCCSKLVELALVRNLTLMKLLAGWTAFHFVRTAEHR
ncbi:MAG: hypothetical protein RI984_1989, partial [Pseudomonadota bacterium]